MVRRPFKVILLKFRGRWIYFFGHVKFIIGDGLRLCLARL